MPFVQASHLVQRAASEGSSSSSAEILIDGLSIDTWVIVDWLPPELPSIVGTAVAIFVPFWEFFVLFPSEFRIWHRMLTTKPFRWHFAPIMTLILRYLLIVFAFSNAFSQWGNSNTNVTCAVQSVLFCVTNVLISSCAVLAMAWRTNAVVRGVIQHKYLRVGVQALLFVLMIGNIVMCFIFLIWSQFTGSWSARQVHGVCLTSATNEAPDAVDVTGDTEFWYYVVSILFDAYCALTVTVALRRLARHSHGFSKLIYQLVFHSVGYITLILLLMLLGIIWLRVQNAFWAANFIQIIQGAIVVRILMAEQEKAQRPRDTDAYSTQSEMSRSYGTGVHSLATGASHMMDDSTPIPGPTMDSVRERHSSTAARKATTSGWTGSYSLHSSDDRNAPAVRSSASIKSVGDLRRTSLPRHVQSERCAEGAPGFPLDLSPDAILPVSPLSPLSSPRKVPANEAGHASVASLGDSGKGSEKDSFMMDDLLASTHVLTHSPYPGMGPDVEELAASSHAIGARPMHSLKHLPRATKRSLSRHIGLVRPGSWSHESSGGPHPDVSVVPVSPRADSFTFSPFGMALGEEGGAHVPQFVYHGQEPDPDSLNWEKDGSSDRHKTGTVTVEPFRPDT